jgi:hypothetical protein
VETLSHLRLDLTLASGPKFSAAFLLFDWAANLAARVLGVGAWGGSFFLHGISVRLHGGAVIGFGSWLLGKDTRLESGARTDLIVSQYKKRLLHPALEVERSGEQVGLTVKEK